MIRKIMVAMVVAAMLVATAAPAFAQNTPQLAPAPDNEELNLALANLEQECEIDLEQNTLVVQSNEQNNEQNQTGVSGEDIVIIGDVNQSQSSEQNAANVANVEPVQANTGDVKCDAAIVQLQDVFALFFGDERNGEPPNDA